MAYYALAIWALDTIPFNSSKIATVLWRFLDGSQLLAAGSVYLLGRLFLGGEEKPRRRNTAAMQT